jgi:hypothetical protein
LENLVKLGFDSTIVTSIFTGRVMRHLAIPHVCRFGIRIDKLKSKVLRSQGIVPLEYELDKFHEEGKLTEVVEDDCVLR